MRIVMLENGNHAYTFQAVVATIEGTSGMDDVASAPFLHPAHSRNETDEFGFEEE